MTEDEEFKMLAAIKVVEYLMRRRPSLDDEEHLYQWSKAVHSAGLGVYCALSEIWRAREPARPVVIPTTRTRPTLEDIL